MAIELVEFRENVDIHANEKRIIMGQSYEGMGFSRLRTVRVNINCQLGGHWREFPELYGVIGRANFILQDIDTKERRNYELIDGQQLLIPPKVALKIDALEGTIITVCFPQVDLDKKSHKYEIN